MIKVISKISRCINSTYEYLDSYGAPFVELYCRVYIALIFWKSGSLALQDWDAVSYLYQYEFHVPYLHYCFAAVIGVGMEVVASILLAAGLAGRVAALTLFCTTLIIQLTYREMEVHVLWMLILALLIVRGPGKFSIDYFLKKRFFQGR